jgi:NitT/TauT family transport system ATP-binding protein
MSAHPQAESRLSGSDATPVVSLRAVGKTFASGTVALDDTTLSVRAGEFVSFVGPSGCGKSTILRIVAGLTDQTQGDVTVLDNAEVSFVFQEPTLMPWATLRDNVMLPLTLRGAKKAERREAADRVLETVGLLDQAKALPRQLSGGMRMRASIARALITRPKLLLMDEPFGALDEITRQDLQEELLRLWAATPGMSVLFVTHNVFEAVYLSSRVLVMSPRPGRIAGELSIEHAYPRIDSFRSTPGFAATVGRVSTALRTAAAA